MRAITITAIAAVICLPLAACSSNEPAKSPAPTASKASEPGTSTPAPAADLALGTSAHTVGSDGTGALEITPTSVVYMTQNFVQKATNGWFVLVTIKSKAETAAPAAQAAPMSGGGWKWVAPDGQAIEAGNANAISHVPEGFEGGGVVQPGTFQWGSSAFDIAAAQKGGTLMYTDGAKTVYRWKIPAVDTGPQAAAIQKQMAP